MQTVWNGLLCFLVSKYLFSLGGTCTFYDDGLVLPALYREDHARSLLCLASFFIRLGKSSMFLHMVIVYSFSLLYNIILEEYTTLYVLYKSLSFSCFRALRVILVGTLLCTSLGTNVQTFLVGINSGVELSFCRGYITYSSLADVVKFCPKVIITIYILTEVLNSNLVRFINIFLDVGSFRVLFKKYLLTTGQRSTQQQNTTKDTTKVFSYVVS